MLQKIEGQEDLTDFYLLLKDDTLKISINTMEKMNFAALLYCILMLLIFEEKNTMKF